MTINRAFLILLAVLLLPSLAWAQTDSRATFNVNKDFTDNSDAIVEVVIDCNSGLILDQDKNISEGTDVQFVVTDFTAGLPTNCTITETPVVGYSTWYYINGDEGTASDTGCSFTDIAFAGEYDCTVVNEPDPVEVTIFKEWIIDNEGGDAIDSHYNLELRCGDEIVGGYYSYGSWRYDFYGEGTATEEYTAAVIPDWEFGTDCYVEENVYDSSIEVNDDDCDQYGDNQLHVTIGGVGEDDDRECTITNTVFYEGIPTLSQYGMAILALLMLGVGFVGFRRFV